MKEDVIDIKPKAVVLLIGSNDLSAKENTADAISNINAILDAIAKQNSAPPVVLCKIPPRLSSQAPIDNSELSKLNQQIETSAKARPDVTLIDLYIMLAKPDGTPDEQFFAPDKLHLRRLVTPSLARRSSRSLRN